MTQKKLTHEQQVERRKLKQKPRGEPKSPSVKPSLKGMKSRRQGGNGKSGSSSSSSSDFQISKSPKQREKEWNQTYSKRERDRLEKENAKRGGDLPQPWDPKPSRHSEFKRGPS